MANWDIIFSYDERAAACLAEQGCPHPAPRPGNRLPNTGELMRVLEELGHSKSPLPIAIEGFNWDDEQATPPECFQIRGDLLVELGVLVNLSRRCGQLWMYPDTGGPSIIVDPELDPQAAANLYQELESEPNAMELFHAQMYGPRRATRID